MIKNIKVLNKGVLLSEVLQKNNVDIQMPCSGKGTCGKCKIKVNGKLSKISENEKVFMTEQEIKDGYRMACFTKVFSDISVEINKLEYSRILSDGIYPAFDFNPIIEEDEYAIAVDIGTTTVVIHLFKGDNPKHIGQISAVNRQGIYGADVISRINYSIDNSPEEVHNVIINQLNDMINNMAAEAFIDIQDIKYAVITGNTTMLHFFEGLDPQSIAFAPFKAQSLFGNCIENKIGLSIAGDAEIYLPPCVSAYVGADLVCSICASDMIDIKENSFIVDIGTNGEMAIYKDESLKCCSTAAGPAFEGACIKDGTPSVEGAINKVYFDENDECIKYETINNKAPIGICGSGIIDTVSVLIDKGIIDKSGRLLDNEHEFKKNIHKCNSDIYFKFDDCNISITQKDIRQIQLAKAAIASGIDTLLEESHITLEEIDIFYICGGFGTFLNLYSAENIGLIPDGVIQKAKVLGNAAIMGASMAILNKDKINKLKEISAKCDNVELSSSSLFMDKYINAISF